MNRLLRSLLSPLYGRLLLWFCLANAITLLVSVGLTERLARAAYAQEPDWPQLAQDASDAYLQKGHDGLRRWTERRRAEGINAALYEGERNLSGERPPVPRPLLPRLLADDSIELKPRPNVRFAGQRVVGSDGVARQLVAERGSRPPPPRMGLLLTVQIGLSMLAIGLVGWWLARSIARPVAAIRAGARRVADGDLATRVPAPWTDAQDELGDLARDFNRMATRIESLVAQERGVLQDVSHELRSPLARLHLVLDLAQHAPPNEAAAHFSRAEHEIQRLDRLIGEALALSRLEADLPGREQTYEQLDLAELLRQRASEANLDAQARGVLLQLDTPTAAPISGDPALIARAIDNLLSNAIKFSAAYSRIELGVSADADGGARLTVRDHGPGVPPEELPTLFRPFFRGSNAARAEGHGLGLAIVERVARAHGASVTADNAAGGGLCVVLSFPPIGSR